MITSGWSNALRAADRKRREHLGPFEMSARDSRLSLRRRQLDELQRQLVSLDELALRLREQRQRVTTAEGATGERAEREDKLAQSLAEVDAEAARVREALTAGAAAMRRYEAMVNRRRRKKRAPALRFVPREAEEAPRRAAG